MKKFLSRKVKGVESQFLNVTKHTDDSKMDCMLSISTNKFLNANCKALYEKQGTICQHCYVDKFMKQYKDIEHCLTHNTEILTNRILTIDELNYFCKVFQNQQIVRFEAFGDLINETQLINYNNIAKTCKKTKFALFTKHYNIVLRYLKSGHKLSNNIRLVLSSVYLDSELNVMLLNVFKKYHSNTITFTVTKDKNNPSINCGKKHCIDCRNCYDNKKPVNVIELIK